mgnify:FL=1
MDEPTFRKMVKLKDQQGYTSKPWGEWFQSLFKEMYLNDSSEEMIQKSTRENLLKTWCENFGENLSSIKQGDTIAALVPEEAKKDPFCVLGPALVVGRGPSIFRNKHLELLAEKGFKGTVIATDGALLECLRRGVVPQYVVSVDGNREKIVQWYDDPLVDRHGSRITAILCCMVAHNVVERIEKAGMPYCWFNPQFDDWRKNDSFTRIQMLMTATERHPNGCPNVGCGGNAGTTAWVFAWALLRRSPVGLIGIDMGYYADTPLEETAYYRQLMAGTKGDAGLVSQAYSKMFNPYFNVEVMTDPVFRQYRASWLRLLKDIPPMIRTVNCSEGGCFFTDDRSVPLEYMKLSEFLDGCVEG